MIGTTCLQLGGKTLGVGHWGDVVAGSVDQQHRDTNGLGAHRTHWPGEDCSVRSLEPGCSVCPALRVDDCGCGCGTGERAGQTGGLERGVSARARPADEHRAPECCAVGQELLCDGRAVFDIELPQ